MNPPNHVIDPDGEVIIILRNANSPFAQPAGNPLTSRDSDVFPRLHGEAQIPVEVAKALNFHSEPLRGKGSKKGKDKKKKKGRPAANLVALEFNSPNAERAPEACFSEEPAVEEAAPEAYPTEEPAMEAAVPEEHFVEEHPPEEPAVEGPAAYGDFAASPVQNCLRIQVSAKHLILASPVFKKILSGGWKESITFFQKGSVEVTAESWDIEALLILLRAIHGQYYQVPRKLTLEMLAKIAVITDYYECKEALYFLTDLWINNLEEHIPTRVSRDLILWLWIAWFFQLPSQFKLSTSIAMSQSDGWIDSLGLPISDKVIGSMNECREKAISDLIDLLHETRDAFLHGTRGCVFECSSIMYGALSMQMQSSKLLLPKTGAPLPNLNYNCFVQTVMAFKSPKWCDTHSGYSGYGSCYPHNCSDASFASVFATLEDSLAGLELDRFTN
ncbi:hypothetical protein PITC_099050 [Penicillium italicum]|uniref:BTB domain-containing protein n=1 Tax=Penicillium italicum TaxID=40296 RepID=A0A0A2L5P6_PENIT|nr:hypothetical protein PITC_099050 [Penicillium italicum]